MSKPNSTNEKRYRLTYTGNKKVNKRNYPYTYLISVKCDCGYEYWLDQRNFGRTKMCKDCSSKLKISKPIKSILPF